MCDWRAKLDSGYSLRLFLIAATKIQKEMI